MKKKVLLQNSTCIEDIPNAIDLHQMSKLFNCRVFSTFGFNNHDTLLNIKDVTCNYDFVIVLYRTKCKITDLNRGVISFIFYSSNITPNEALSLAYNYIMK